jgi:hypothetical protein
MSNVVEFSAFEEAPPAAAAPHRRLLLLSRGLSVLFTLIFALIALEIAAGIVLCLFFGSHILMGAHGLSLGFGPGGGAPKAAPGEVRMSDLPFATRLAGAAGWIIVSTPLLFLFHHLRRLFGLYARGIVFAAENAAHIQRIGVWLIVYPFANYVCNALFWLAGGADRAEWFHFEQVQAFVLGLIVVAIAQVMAFGHDIEQEKDSFI